MRTLLVGIVFICFSTTSWASDKVDDGMYICTYDQDALVIFAGMEQRISTKDNGPYGIEIREGQLSVPKREQLYYLRKNKTGEYFYSDEDRTIFHWFKKQTSGSKESYDYFFQELEPEVPSYVATWSTCVPF